MSETWGPRAHPERCSDEMRCSEEAYREEWPKQDAMKRGELILTWLVWGTLTLAAFSLLTWWWRW